MNKYTCFLDLDGVLIDFVGGLSKALGANYSYNDYPFTPGRLDFWRDIEGVVNSDVDHVLRDRNFWANLKWMHDGKDIYDLIIKKFDLDNVYILTGIDDVAIGSAVPGKMEWLGNGPTELTNRVLFAKCSKECVAGPNKILIDDKDSNVVHWHQHGGLSFLVPRPWNSGHRNFDSSLGQLNDYLETVNIKTVVPH
jgi:5'(3')-deoxyribonucleotidase